MKYALLAAIAALFPSPVIALAVPDQYQPVIQIVGWQAKDIPKLAEIITCESNWDAFAIGAQGELGLLQLMPQTVNDARVRLDANVPSEYEVWTNPAANFYAGRVVFDERGWDAWSCA